jgi:hypothetical protein
MMKLSTFSKLGLISVAIAPLMIACTATAEKPDTKTDGGTETKTETKSGWETYTSSEGGFSIDMPGTPTPSEQSVPLPNGKSAPLKIVSIDKKEIAYFVGHIDYPADVIDKSADPQKLLSNSIEGAVGAFDGKAGLQQKATTVDGVPCRTFNTTGKVEGQDAQAEGVFCFENNRLYEVFALGEKSDKFAGEVKPFISSFKITKS